MKHLSLAQNTEKLPTASGCKEYMPSKHLRARPPSKDILGSRTFHILISIVVLLVLAFPTFTIFAAPNQTNQADWPGVDGPFPFNLNWSPQNDINVNNVNNLQVQWLFPVPSAPPAYSGAEGVIVTPIVVNGIVYVVTNYNEIFTLSSVDGHVLWSRGIGAQTFLGKPSTAGHQHAIWYTSTVREKPLIWIFANNNSIYAFNALTGDKELSFPLFAQLTTIPGNFGIPRTFGHSMAIDEKRGILVTGVEGSEGTDAARGFFAGFDITQSPPKLLWRTFTIPPQDGSDPNWDIRSIANMTHAFVFDGHKAIDLKSLPQSQIHDIFYGDWGDFGFNGTHSYAGSGVGWGGTWAVDKKTGMTYVSTAQPGPDFNATTRPGPNLWSDSILAIDDTSGKLVWGFQTTSHDLWDFDCAWNVVLANATINGQTHEAVFKGCKDGRVYALDAATGSMYWYYFSPSITNDPKFTYSLDPTNKTHMNLRWPSQATGQTHVLYDATGTGNIEADIAYDPVANLVFVAPYNIPSRAVIAPVTGPKAPYGSIGIVGSFGGFTSAGAANTTITAIDASTGKARWSYFLPKIPYRGGLTVSGQVVYMTTIDGVLRMLDENSGTLVASKLIGGPMVIQPAIASDSNGNVKLYLPVSASSVFPAGVKEFPGVVLALGVGSQSNRTVTVTTTTTNLGGGGVDPTVFYATAAVAIIFVIATAVVSIRRRSQSVAPIGGDGGKVAQTN